MLYQQIAEQNCTANGIRIENGASTDVVTKFFSHSATSNGNRQRVEAFMRIDDMESKKTDARNAAYPEHRPINLFY
ncbi:MAG: hypothetical protein K2H04_10565 [Bacteroidaceae bacterium]|nr:hypothetical protein [Bacteroidaceae bacterium]